VDTAIDLIAQGRFSELALSLLLALIIVAETPPNAAGAMVDATYL
jgi:hypothetical protein